MPLHAYRFFFSEPIEPDEVVEVARSPIHSAIKAGIDHGEVVFDCADALGRLEFRANGRAASLTTQSRYAREMVEIIEEAAHGRIVLASELFSGATVLGKDMPIEMRGGDTPATIKRRMKAQAKKLLGVDLGSDELDLLWKIVDLEKSNSRVAEDMFDEDEIWSLVLLQEKGVVEIGRWHSITIKEGLTRR